MIKCRNIGFAALLLFLSFSSFSETIKVGLIDYPPHISFNERNSDSPLLQYISKFLMSLGFQIEFVKLPKFRGALELKSGNIDLLLPFDESHSDVKMLSFPIFYSVPGLCFKKENFIPILSAIHRINGLIIGVPVNSTPILPLKASNAKLVMLQGERAINRGIDLTQRGRLDAFYHPNPRKVYHRKNKMYKEVACSYFNGYSKGVFIAVSPSMPLNKLNLIEQAYQESMTELSYEYYFAIEQQKD